jgi:cytoskeleton protein RodZ
MKETGLALKEARIKQGLTVSEISMATKINPKVLQAMEEGEISALPAKTFTRGFVRIYAQYLKIDVNEVLAVFAREMDAEQAPPAVAGATETPVPTDGWTPMSAPPVAAPKTESKYLRNNDSLSRFIVAGGIVALVALIVVTKAVVEKYEREKVVATTAAPAPTVTVVEPSEPVAVSPAEPVAVSPAEPADIVASDASIPAAAPGADSQTPVTPAIPTQASSAVAASPLPERASPVPAAQTAPPVDATAVAPAPAAAPIAAKPTAPTAVITPTPSNPAATKPASTGPSATKPSDTLTAAARPTPSAPPKVASQEVILEALDKVKVTFEIDGGGSQVIDMNPEEIKTIKAKSSILVSLSDAGAVNVTHNGRDRGVPGQLGSSKTLKFP